MLVCISVRVFVCECVCVCDKKNGHTACRIKTYSMRCVFIPCEFDRIDVKAGLWKPPQVFVVHGQW